MVLQNCSVFTLKECFFLDVILATYLKENETLDPQTLPKNIARLLEYPYLDKHQTAQLVRVIYMKLLKLDQIFPKHWKGRRNLIRNEH